MDLHDLGQHAETVAGGHVAVQLGPEVACDLLHLDQEVQEAF